ncbi:MAG: hypothetical protein IJ577_02780 [Prevotella sp.]|nr:hypothetical protein [Prevotella sp.]
MLKNLKFRHSALAVLMLAVAFTSCSSDDEGSNDNPLNTPYHYDLTVTVDKHGGMSRDKVHYTMSVASLSDATKEYNFTGSGAEISEYTMEAIYKGKYMYQVPNSNDRFVKLQFKNNTLQVVSAQPFKTNTYKARNYTHAWLNDNTLLIMSTDGDHQKVIWTKLNTDDMTILSEGTLNLNVADGYNVLTTSGIAAYRKSDDKVFYFYYNKKETSGSNKTTNEDFFRIAVINASTMAVEQEIVNKEAAQPQGSAYGELLQDIVFFDENDNLYLSAFSAVSKKNIGQLLRIQKGKYDFDAGYNAFPDALGKLLTVQYLGNGKVLAYSGDASIGTSIDTYAYYYSIIDLNTKTSTRLQYNGADLPVSGGSFSQRSVVDTKEKKAYFGVDAENAQPQIYVYDIATGSVTAGAKIAEGYYFEQIRIVED